MSCNGCRILRKGCSDFCVLRSSIQWIDGADAQSHATVFVAKFFGRAGLLSFLSSVPEPNRPALFRSLLYEACGRTVNPVTGAVGLQWTGNWDVCEAAVEIVLRGGIPLLMPELGCGSGLEELYGSKSYLSAKRRNGFDGERSPPCDLDLCLTSRSPVELKLRAATPSMNLDESVMTSEESEGDRMELGERRLLSLFV